MFFAFNCDGEAFQISESTYTIFNKYQFRTFDTIYLSF